MSQLNRFVARLVAFLNSRDLDRDLDNELETHFDLLIEENIRRGLAPEQARREARLKLGNLDSLREAHRETRGLPLIDTMLQDLKFTFRILRRDLSFTFFAILIVSLGIGASALIFSVVNTVLLRPLPFKDADKLVWIANKKSVPEQTTQVGNLLDAREANRSFEKLGAYFAYYNVGDIKLTGDGEPERLTGIPVSQNFFHVLGVEPQIGRLFTADECKINGPAVVLLTDNLWKRRFGSDPAIVGKTVRLNELSVTVVGVMPSTFDFASIFAPGSHIDLYRPFPLTPETDGMGNTAAVVGRLKPGVTLEGAQADFSRLGPQIHAQHPERGNEFEPLLSSLKEHVTGRLRPALLVLAGAVGVVMLIVCANLSNLLLARNSSRQKEMAIRVSLGAARSRLVRQMLTESFVLSGAGAIAGVLVALIGARVLTRLEAVSIPLLSSVQIDFAVLSFTLVIAIITGVAFGLVPALQVPVIGVNESLKNNNRGSTGNRKQSWLRSALVVAEVAFACLLLVGTGLLVRSFLKVLDVNLGFQPERVVAIRIDPGGAYPTQTKRNAYFDEALRLVQNTNGIEASGLTDVLPLEGDRSWGVAGKGQIYQKDDHPEAFVRIVSEGYLKAMGIPLLAGRDFTDHDTPQSEPVIIVNKTLAERLWPGQDPIGQVVTQDGGRRVVGVVGGVRHVTVEEESGSEMYLPMRQTNDFSAVQLVVRTNLPKPAVSSAIRSALQPIAPNLGGNEFRTIQQLVDKATSPRRVVVMLLTGFSTFALVLAALGIYAVISYSVHQRTHEIGIRMALGESAGTLQMRIIRQTLQLAAIGLIIGLASSWMVTRVLVGLLFGVSANDPVSFIIMATILALVAATAGYFPARRASRINPITALRSN